MENLEKLLDPSNLERNAGSAANVLVAAVTAYGLRVLGAIAILVIGWLAARLVHNTIIRACRKRDRLDPTIATFLAQVVRYAIITFTIIAVLTTFGVETTSLVAALGALGLAIGLAVQGTLSNFAAGLMLIIFRPFRVGEYIEASGVAGTVRQLTLFVTELDTFDNLRLVVPNGKIWGEIIRNYSKNDTRRLDIRVRVSYDENISEALSLISEKIGADSRVLADPAPVVALESLGEAAVVVVSQIWVPRTEYFRVMFDLNAELKRLFEEERLAVAYPQRIVSTVTATGKDEDSGSPHEKPKPTLAQ